MPRHMWRQHSSEFWQMLAVYKKWLTDLFPVPRFGCPYKANDNGASHKLVQEE